MISDDRIFALQLERAHLRAIRLAAAARQPYEPPAWVNDQLADVEGALERMGRSQAMATLVSRASLSPAVEGLVWMLATAAFEPRAQAHLVSALGDIRRGVSVGGYAAFAELDAATSRELIEVLDLEHPVFVHHLIEAADPRISAATPLAVPRRIVDHLAGRATVEPMLEIAMAPPRTRLDGRQSDMLQKLVDAIATKRPAILSIEGPRGAGRGSAAAIAAAELGHEVVVFDAQRAGNDLARGLAALHREIFLRENAVPMIANADGVDQQAIVEFARRQPGVTLLSAREGVLDLAGDLTVVRFSWNIADHATRHAVWSDLLGDAFAGRDHEVAHLAHRYRLGPGGIDRAVRSAKLAVEDGAALSIHDVVMGVRGNIAERLRTLARHIEVVESWSDLVLPPDAKDTIRSLIDRVRFGHKVYEEWGFRRRASRGTGVPVLFSGAPGTGKTMTAGLIARELELELYQIDLSQVVSKWVGETEKNLGQVFEAAEAGHALLLFDEADALFAKRTTDVKGAQDRYANLEVNYLLQRIEAFSGIAILTTNLDTSIDSALKRRLAAHILFYPPDEEERTNLWERMTGSGEAPIECTRRDFEILARDFPDMSGAHIRNAVLAAAFVAAAEGGALTRARLARAAQMEYRSMGRVLSQK